MLKGGKVGVAIVMGLLLSLTLLVSGAFAQDTTITHNTGSATTRNVTLTATGDIQQGTQQMLPMSSTQSLKPGQSSYRCRGYNCRGFRYRRPLRFTGTADISDSTGTVDTLYIADISGPQTL